MMIIGAVELKRRYLQRVAGAHDRQAYIGPEIVTMDISNACDLRCQYCSAEHAPGNPHHVDKARFFPWERFLGVVRDCVALNVDEIHIVGPGEPTIHPLFRDMMRHLEQQPLKSRLYTNATFPLDYCSDVIKLDHVTINLGAVDRQAYRELQGKDLFDRVVVNIKRLVSLRDAVKPGFWIEIVYIVNAVNINQKQKMRDMASKLGVNGLDFYKMHVNEFNKGIALPEGSLDGDPKRTPPVCLNGWFFMAIKLNGHASTCCWIHQMPFGDFDKISFKEFWLSPRLMNLRLLGKYGRIQKMFKACQTCSDYDKNIRRSLAVEEEVYEDQSI
jgi:MoaA/NifB/PqqE/SkfB family radical SAM enzyme